MGRFPSEFADPYQRLGLLGQGAEGLSALASLPSRSAPFPRGPELHHGDAAIELGHGTEHLPDEATPFPASSQFKGPIERMAARLRQVVGRDDGLNLPLPSSLPECHVPSWVCRSASQARSQEFSALSRHVKPTLATAC